MEKYQKGLQKGGSKNMMVDTWRKLGWTFLKKEDVQNLKADLSTQHASIVFLLNLYNSYVRIPYVPRAELTHSPLAMTVNLFS